MRPSGTETFFQTMLIWVPADIVSIGGDPALVERLQQDKHLWMAHLSNRRRERPVKGQWWRPLR